MKKQILILILASVLASCATPMKPIPAKTSFDTGMGFSAQIPPNGPWYEIKTTDNTGYVLGREPSPQDKEDGSTVIAEIRFGHINLAGLKLKKAKDILKFFETTMKDPSQTDRFEKTTSTFKPNKFKGAECMNYEQISQNDKVTKSRQGDPMMMNARGLICLHPKDLGRYIRLTISQRTPMTRAFLDLKSDETKFYDSLVFGPLPKSAP